MKLLYKFLRLPSADQRLLVQSVLLLGVIRLGLWLLPFQTLQHLLANVARKPSRQRNTSMVSSERIARAVTVASQYVPAATCLPQALATQMLLVRCGHPARLRIGLIKGATGQVEGHAWVESQGSIVIGGSGLERYTLLSAFQGESL